MNTPLKPVQSSQSRVLHLLVLLLLKPDRVVMHTAKMSGLNHHLLLPVNLFAVSVVEDEDGDGVPKP